EYLESEEDEVDEPAVAEAAPDSDDTQVTEDADVAPVDDEDVVEPLDPAADLAAAAEDAVQAEVGDDPVERVQPDVPAGDVPSEAAEEQALTAEPAVEGSELGGAADDPASEPT
ncbi:MAG TPA: hypothetical protein DCS55_12460, partial [Acidimicrobiaceae bacterium]|nr:hypothetical protein [Acidimicrobiaceae bacterium]